MQRARMKRWMGFLSILALCSVSAEALELHEAIEQTIKNNPIIQERLNNFRAVKEDTKYATSAYLPKVDLRYGTGSETAKSVYLPAQDAVNMTVTEQSLTMSYNLFNGFKDYHNSDQQEARLRSAAYSYVENVDDTLLKLIEQYTNVLRHKELMVVEKDNIEMDEKIYENMLGKQKQGLQRLSDLKEARSKLALAYANHLSEENNIQDTLVAFHKVLGRYISLDEISTPKFHEQLPNTIEEITRIALENNPSIKVATYERDATLNAYKGSRSSYYPKVDIEVSESATENISGYEGEATSSKAMVYLTYNLFNGFSDKAYTQKKVSELHQKSEEIHKIKRDVIEAIQLSWNAFRITSKQSVFISWYVQSSKDKLNSYYKEFNIGRRSLIDLLGASDDYNNARRKMINTKYDLIFARYRLLDAMGELSGALGFDVKSHVGLSSHMNLADKKDEMQFSDDQDKDKVLDSEDICTNSIVDANETGSSVDHYGCKERIRSNNSDFKVLESFLTESIKTFVKESDEIEGWE